MQTNLKIGHWFPTALGEAYHPNPEKEYKRLLPHIDKIKGEKDECFNYYQLHKDKKFNNINKFVIAHVNEFSKKYNFGPMKVADSWFNDYMKYNVNSPHAHLGSIFTAVYYLVGYIEDIALVIHSPTPPDMMNPSELTAKYPVQNINPLTVEDIIIKPSTGYLCIFRSFLSHEVPLKITDHRRISLSYTFIKDSKFNWSRGGAVSY